MRAMMEDLLSVWTVEDEWRDLLNLHSHSHASTYSHSDSTGSPNSNPQRRGWRLSPMRSKCRRRGHRPVMPQLSPYFVPKLPKHSPTATGKTHRPPYYNRYNTTSTTTNGNNNNNNNSNSIKSNTKKPHRPCQRAEPPRRHRPTQESYWMCMAGGRPPLSTQATETESVDTSGTTSRPHIPIVSQSSWCAGGKFFNSLARVSRPCSGKSDVLPEVKCCANGGNVATSNSSVTTTSSITNHPPYLRQGSDFSFNTDGNADRIGSGSSVLATPISGIRQSNGSGYSSSRERLEDEVTVTETNRRTDLLKWETLCASEKNIMKRRETATQKLRHLQAQIKKTGVIVDILRSKELTVRDQRRSYARLQASVVREERKCQELERLAERVGERARHLSSPLEEGNDFAKRTSTGFIAEVDVIFSITSLLERRSALQRERADLKETLRTAALESTPQPPHHGKDVRRSSPPKEIAQQQYRRQLLLMEHRRLKLSIADLKAKENQIKEKTKCVEMRTRALTKRLETLRASARERREQYLRGVTCEAQPTQEVRMAEKNNVAVEEPHRSFFITDVVA